MKKYDQAAKNKGVMIITGASSVPGLSSAVLE
jgi:saccharopine dehydrogenase-like NADP-dependent oxidoreductase